MLLQDFALRTTELLLVRIVVPTLRQVLLSIPSVHEADLRTTELILFGLFPLDLTAAKEFGTSAPVLRAALFSRTAAVLAPLAGLSESTSKEFVATRMSEYAGSIFEPAEQQPWWSALLHSRVRQAPSIGEHALPRLARIALQNMCGLTTQNPVALVPVFTFFSSTHRNYSLKKHYDEYVRSGDAAWVASLTEVAAEVESGRLFKS